MSRYANRRSEEMMFSCTDCNATTTDDILDLHGQPHEGCEVGGLWVGNPLDNETGEEALRRRVIELERRVEELKDRMGAVAAQAQTYR